MLLYLDSSALVKRYVDEPMSEAVRALMDEAPAAATALTTHTEVGAALARAMRDSRLEVHAASNDRSHLVRSSGRQSEASRDLRRGLKVLSKPSRVDTIQSI